MIDYNKIQKKTKEATTIISDEKTIIAGLLKSQNDLKDMTKSYSEQISNNFTDNEVFKNMLTSSVESASLQILINIRDLENLSNILDIISSRGKTLKDDVEQYNVLLSKIEKNINFVDEIMQRTKSSIEQLSNISKSDAPKKKTSKSTKTSKSSKSSDAPVPRDIKKISDKKPSDLLCFFPKTANDIMAISTIQDTYQIFFNEENVTISIEEENFNFTLKAIGVQISNTSNVLLVSRKSQGFFVITNMVIDVPDFITISKITRNKNFLEFEISNPELYISIKENELTFLENCDIVNSKITINSNKSENGETSKNNDLIKELIESKEDNIVVSKKETASNKKSVSADSDKNMDLLKDNDTLIISEKDNQVILPYTLEEVEKLYNKNKKKYSSVQDLIKNEYIISTDNFKNPIKSRFREAYQLIKKREHGHLKEAVDLGFELMFQSNLNPAVIAACKSLKELDIYLDCLDDNELDKFSCFNIVYNVPPTKKK